MDGDTRCLGLLVPGCRACGILAMPTIGPSFQRIEFNSPKGISVIKVTGLGGNSILERKHCEKFISVDVDSPG